MNYDIRIQSLIVNNKNKAIETILFSNYGVSEKRNVMPPRCVRVG